MPSPDPGGDNGAYVSLARSLIERHQYVDLWDPALPPHTQYPPVFAGILALAMMLGIEPWIGLQLLMIPISMAGVALSYLWLRRATSPGVAAGAALAIALGAGVLRLSHAILSDMPFWVLTMAALLALEIDRQARAQSPANRAPRALIIGCAAAIVALFTRSAGLPLAVAVLGYLVLHRRLRAAASFAIACSIPMILWAIRAAHAGGPGYGSYLWMVDPYRPALGRVGLGGLISRVGHNIERYLSWHFPDLIAAQSLVTLIIAILCVVLALVTWGKRIRRPAVADLWIPMYIGLLLLWPATWSGERFLLPALPLLLGYAGETLRWIGQRLRFERPMLIAAAVVLAVVGAVPTFRSMRIGISCTGERLAGSQLPCLDPRWKDLLQLAGDVRGKLPPGTVVFARKPTLWFAISGYQSRVYPMSAQPDTFFAAARAARARFVVLDQVPDLSPLYLQPVILAARDRFCVVKELNLPNAVLLRIDSVAAVRPANTPENSVRVCPP